MQKQDFIAFLDKLARYYGGEREAGAERLRMWFEIVAGIPAHSLEGVFVRIVKIYKFHPTNVPKAILDAYEQWSAENPDRVRAAAASAPRGKCPDGCDNGVFYVQRQVDGRWVSTVAFCRTCRGGNATTRAELERSGAVVYPLLNPAPAATNDNHAAQAAHA